MERKYLVVEIQTNADGTVGNLVYAYDELNQAESKYHAVLSAAALSGLPMHAAVLLRSDGAALASKFYEVLPEPEEVDEPLEVGDE